MPAHEFLVLLGSALKQQGGTYRQRQAGLPKIVRAVQQIQCRANSILAFSMQRKSTTRSDQSFILQRSAGANATRTRPAAEVS